MMIVEPKALNSTTVIVPRNSQNKVFLAIFPVILTSTICQHYEDIFFRIWSFPLTGQLAITYYGILPPKIALAYKRMF